MATDDAVCNNDDIILGTLLGYRLQHVHSNIHAMSAVWNFVGFLKGISMQKGNGRKEWKCQMPLGSRAAINTSQPMAGQYLPLSTYFTDYCVVTNIIIMGLRVLLLYSAGM